MAKRSRDIPANINTKAVLVEGDVNGDGRADFQIQVHGVLSLTADNFFL
jgi:hypothetical protein